MLQSAGFFYSLWLIKAYISFIFRIEALLGLVSCAYISNSNSEFLGRVMTKQRNMSSVILILFLDYAAAQLRQYHRLTKQIKPDLETYERLREKHGEEFFPTSNSLLHGTHVPSTEEIDRMVIDLEKQIEKRDKYSRRRPYNDDADIDYINERNAKFNKKAERFYGKYTAEIKQNLERGTAV